MACTRMSVSTAFPLLRVFSEKIGPELNTMSTDTVNFHSCVAPYHRLVLVSSTVLAFT